MVGGDENDDRMHGLCKMFCRVLYFMSVISMEMRMWKRTAKKVSLAKSLD